MGDRADGAQVHHRSSQSAGGLPSSLRLPQRMIYGHRGYIMFVVFDLLGENGGPLVKHPYLERRSRREALQLAGQQYADTPATGAGGTPWRWARDRGIQGIEANRLSGSDRPDERGSLKIKNRDYGWEPGRSWSGTRRPDAVLPPCRWRDPPLPARGRSVARRWIPRW